MSAYDIVLEDDYPSEAGDPVTVPASGNAKTTLGISFDAYWYLNVDGIHITPGQSGNELRAKYRFLYDTAGMCVNGTGKLSKEHGGYYIFCPQSLIGVDLKNHHPEELGVGFEWQPFHDFEAMETVAVCKKGAEKSVLLQYKGKEIVIPELETFMKQRGHDAVFRITDTGEGLCKSVSGMSYEKLDIFAGDGEQARRDLYFPLINAFPNTNPLKVYLK